MQRIEEQLKALDKNTLIGLKNDPRKLQEFLHTEVLPEMDAFGMLRDNKDEFRKDIAARAASLRILVEQITHDYPKFLKSLARLRKAKKLTIPDEYRNSKNKMKNYLKEKLASDEAVLANFDNPVFQQILNMASDTRSSSQDATQTVVTLLEKSNISLTSLKDFSKNILLLDADTFLIEIAVRKTITRLLLDFINQLGIDGNEIEVIVKTNLVENLKCTTKIKELLGITILKICMDYLIKNKTHNHGMIDGVTSYKPLKRIISLFTHMRPEALITSFTLEDFSEEFKLFKNKTVDIRQELCEILPELNEVEITSLTQLVTTTRATLIEFAENSYVMTEDLQETIQEYQLTDIAEWKKQIFNIIYEKLEATPQFANDVRFRIVAHLEKRLLERAFADKDFFISEDYEAKMKTYLQEITAKDQYDLLKSEGIGVFDFETSRYKDDNGIYEATPLGLFAACIDGDVAAVRALLRSKALQNNTINHVCDEMKRTPFIVALTSKRKDLISLFIFNSHTDYEVVRDNSKYAHLLDTPLVNDLMNARARQAEFEARSNYSNPQMPVYTPALIEEEETNELDNNYFSNITPDSSLKNLISLVEENIRAIEAAEEKVSLEVNDFIAVAKKLLDDEQELISSAGKSDVFSNQRIFVKQHKKMKKKIAVAYSHLDTQNASLIGQLLSLQENSTVRLSETEAPSQVIEQPAITQNPVSSAAVTFFYNPASSQEQQIVKEALAQDIAQLKIFIETDFKSQLTILTNKSELHFISMHVHAILFQTMTFLEKYNHLPVVIASDFIAKNAKLMRNALVHCKGIFDENILYPKVTASPEALSSLLEAIVIFAKHLTAAYVTKNYTATSKDPFCLRLVGHGNALLEQKLSRKAEVITDAEKIFYTQRLTSMQLKFQRLPLADSAACKQLRETAMKMLLTKLEIYGLYYLPKRVVSVLKAERHYEPPRLQKI